MNREAFFYLGKILKTHGNKGNVLVLLDVDEPQKYRKLESVYLDLHGERIPFFINRIELMHNRKAAMLFDGFETNDEASILQGLEMYLPAEKLPALKGKKFYYHEVTGFRVTDLHHGDIGSVEEVLDLPHQALLKVRFGEKEILIPVVDEIIRKVDRANKLISIEAPDGLIEIYL